MNILRKNSILFGFLALTCFTLQAMESDQSRNSLNAERYALTPVYCEEAYKMQGSDMYDLRQDIYARSDADSGDLHLEFSDTCKGFTMTRHYKNIKPIGYIRYNDICFNGVTRSIREFEIEEETLRRRGIGTHCLKKFIAQSTAEGVNRLTLTSYAHTIPLYTRVGFQSVGPASNMRQRLIHSNPYQPLFNPATYNTEAQ